MNSVKHSISFGFAMFMVLTFMLVPATQAQETDAPVATFNQWRLFVEGSGLSKTCYILGEPQQTAPGNVTRGDIFITLTHRPGQGVRNEVAVSVGYPFSAQSNPFAKIGNTEFNFFTGIQARNSADDWAWLRKLDQQERLVTAMKRGRTLVFKCTSARNTLTTDTYSLSGVTAATKALDAACPAS
jgi:hypothetical protein